MKIAYRFENCGKYRHSHLAILLAMLSAFVSNIASNIAGNVEHVQLSSNIAHNFQSVRRN